MTQSAQRNALLVIGYGNTLRNDDGVGPQIAAAVSGLNLPGVRAIGCHQLTPELAEPISRARTVIFVDAMVEPATAVQTRELAPADSGQILAHAADPRSLLALARDIFGHCPKALWLTVPIEDAGFGEQLSPLAQRGMQEAIDRIQAFL